MENQKAKDKLQRQRELTEKLYTAARAYEQEDREIISNFEYDRLYDELKALEQENGIVLANSPTVKVGFEVLSDLPKEKHESPMLSLDKTKSREELAGWLKDKQGVLSWKMDGLTVVLTYDGGELVKAVTRGNGEIGEVITNNARVFKNVPLTIPYKGMLVIRGEAIIRYSDFEKINAGIEDVEGRYKNPRNLCSGSVRQLNNQITAERSVYLYAFALISAEKDFTLRSEQLDWLEALGFTVVERRLVNAGNVIDSVQYFEEQVSKNDFPSDGLVLVYDDIAYGNSLGRTAKFPRDGIAFKWADELRETVLREIDWSASRTGLINPVAVFDPVELEGTTVSRASLHNLSIIEDLELGIGDTVTVYKANMIIPQIAENLTRSNNLPIPKVCPVCGGAAEIHVENDVKTLYCTNPLCTAKKIKLFSHMVARDALNVEGLSEMTLEKFLEEGFLSEPADLFRLSAYADRIKEMEGFGAKSCENLLSEIEKARETNLSRVVYSVGIPNIGLANARLICRHFNNDADKVMNAEAEELTGIDQIGEVLAKSFTDYFADEEKRAAFMRLLSEVRLTEEAANASEKLKDMVFVITGSVEKFANRNELKAFIENNGGKVTGSVTGKTTYLINNDNTSASTKNKTAKSLGVAIITEDEFMGLLED